MIPESRRVNLRDIAEDSGVSIQTVSRVVRGINVVAEETRVRVMASVERLGYRPNLAARSLSAHRTGQVIVLVAVPLLYGHATTFVEVCQELAELLGYKNYAELSLATKMAESSDQVLSFLRDLAVRSKPFAEQDLAELPESEQKIIRLIAMRLLSATGEKHIYDETSVTLTCEGYEFKAKGKTVVQDGWKAIERCFKETLKSKEKDEPEHSLPSLNEKDILSSVDSSVTEHYTSPPKPYTEDSLLSAMETAGNAEFDDDTEKKGLGTPATRAGIIEKLVKGGFVERRGKSLVPTKDGNNLVCVLPEQITSPSMTAEWENTLMQIERGNADADKFLSGIVEMTSELVKAYPFLSDTEANRFDTGRESIGKCPRCGSPVYVGKGNYYCSNKECSFCMWEDNKFFSSKVENIRLLERLHRLIKNYLTGEKETLPNGETVIKVGSAADFSNQALQWLQTEGLVPPDAEGPKYHNDIKNIGALARLKLIFKTNVRQSIGAAQWEASMKPANLKAWPAFRFIRITGAKTKRLVHVINEDAVRLKTDFTFWADEMNAASLGGFEVPWPPFGFNS